MNPWVQFTSQWPTSRIARYFPPATIDGVAAFLVSRSGATIPSFDLIIPTYNRGPLLRGALQSVVDVIVPDGVAFHCVVVDNNSADPEVQRQMVAEFNAIRPGVFSCLFEPTQGVSHARNAAIGRSTADWIGMIDDDEAIDPAWLVTVSEWLQRDDVDFVTGLCVSKYDSPPPAWFRATAYWGSESTPTQPFPIADRVMLSGNSAVKRSVLQQVGGYNTTLGRSGARMYSHEDTELHERLMAAGVRGYFVAEMKILHFIPDHRLTRRYVFRLHFDTAVSEVFKDYDRLRDEPVTRFGPVPRYLLRAALRAGGGGIASVQRQVDFVTLCGSIWGHVQASRRRTQLVPTAADYRTGS